MLIPALLLMALAAPSSQQGLQSPCPEVLKYEPISKEEPNRWYATITFPPGANWLFLSITLDKKAYILANWYGEVTTQDNTEYKIDTPSPEVRSKRQPLRFYVQFDPEEAPPKVQLIRVDGREICFDNGVRQNYIDPPASFPVAESTTTRSVPAPPSFPTTEATFRVPIDFFDKKEPVQCGVVKMNNPVALVVDGTSTLEGQWPWQVALYWNQFVNYNYKCGGTLVSRRHVITAAHCVTVADSRPPQKILETTLAVYLGKHDLVLSYKGVQIRAVSKITVHPEYDTLSTFSRDLSILDLQEPIQYTNWVQPACLWPDKYSDLNSIIGQKGSVVGWGNNGSGKLLLVEMPVVSQETCLRAKGDFYISVTSDFTYCAGSRNGQSACNGDSGGGMFFKLNGVWHIRGVVSLSPSKANEKVCDPTFYVVFTDLAKFLPWIRENIEPY